MLGPWPPGEPGGVPSGAVPQIRPNGSDCEMVVMPELTEPVLGRIGDLPVRPAARCLGCGRRLAEAEADLVFVAGEASRVDNSARMALPGGSSNLAAAVALHTAVRAARTHRSTQPGPLPSSPDRAPEMKRSTSEVDSHPIAAGLSGLCGYVPTGLSKPSAAAGSLSLRRATDCCSCHPGHGGPISPRLLVSRCSTNSRLAAPSKRRSAGRRGGHASSTSLGCSTRGSPQPDSRSTGR